MNDLNESRKIIDKIDNELLDLLKKRFGLMPKIARYKECNDISVFQPDREKVMIIDRKKLAKEKGISVKIVEDIFKLIVRHSRDIQTDTLNK